MMWAVRTPKLTGDTAGYGQGVPLLGRGVSAYPQLAVLWHTQTAAVAAPFVPFFMGTADVPPEYKQHRYLTFDESGRFVDSRRKPDQQSAVSQGIESTRSAFQLFKRLFYLVMEHHEAFLPEVTVLFEAFEEKLIQAHDDVVRTAVTLLEAGEIELASDYLTYYSQTEAMNALQLAEVLAASLEMKTKMLYGIRDSKEVRGVEQIW